MGGLFSWIFFLESVTMNKTLCTILAICILNSCKKEEFNIENLNGNRITAMGHAGMGIGSSYPMNSCESILKCLHVGMDGSEFDVQMTKDSVLVAYHDQDLSDHTNLNGQINSFSWDEIKFAHYTQTAYLDYSIVSLEQLFSSIENVQNYKFTFDCKLYPSTGNIEQYYESYITAIIRTIQNHHIENNVYFESQSVQFLEMFKRKWPESKLFIYPPSFQAGLEIALSKGLYGITISTRDITKEQIKLSHDNNLLVAIWNTHTKSENIEAIKKNPDFIQTDEVKSLKKLLR